jgi:hypothetical protein
MPQVIEARYTIGPQLVALLARLFPGARQPIEVG